MSHRALHRAIANDAHDALRGLTSAELAPRAPGDDPFLLALTRSPATAQDDPATFAALIGLGLSPDRPLHAEGRGETTPLYEAALSGLDRVARLLVDSGADPGWANEDRSVLHAAAQGDLPWLVALALEHHDVDLLADGTTPLCDAAWGRADRAVKLLLRRGADPRVRVAAGGWRGYDPLRFAVERSAADVVDLLLSAGVHPALEHVDALTGAELLPEVREDVLFALAHERAPVPPWAPESGALRIAARCLEHLGSAAAERARALLDDDAWTDVLLRAAAAGDVDRVLLYLEPGRPLPERVLRGADARAARVLLDHGAPVDPYDHDFGTPLHAAAAAGDLELTRLLLEHGADPNLASAPEGQHAPETALVIAAARGDAELVRLLLDHGATPDRMRLDAGLIARSMGEELSAADGVDDAGLLDAWGPGVRALYQAATPEVVDILVEAGAAVDADPGPIPAALLRGRVDVARRLFDRGARMTPPALADALDSALRRRAWDESELLIDMGARLRAPSVAVPPAVEARLLAAAAAPPAAPARTLDEAIEHRDGPAVASLLHHAEEHTLGRAIETRDDAVAALVATVAPFGATQLFRAVHLRLCATALALLRRGHPVDVRNDRGDTLLHVAGAAGDARLVRALLERGLDPDDRDANGHSAIRATYWGYVGGGADLDDTLSCMRAMLEAGAVASGLTGQIADHGGDPALFDLLAGHGRLELEGDSFAGRPLFDAVADGRVAQIRALLRHGADVNARRPSSLFHAADTPLHLAAERGDAAVIDVLVDAGADLHAACASGKTALEVARDLRARTHLRARGARDR
jgi:ankyrin repeat protein